MAANLTPQYLDAESEYKKAQTADEKLACLRKMYSLLPKHKASEKLQADLKTKIKHASAEVDHEKHKKKGGVSYKIPRQGAGQVVLVGPPNSGKSRLLSRLTRATPDVAPYPFTTHQPMAGMMDFEDARVQLVDLPPITADVMEGWVSSMVRTADAALFVVDLADDDGPFAAEAVLTKLETTKTELIGAEAVHSDDLTIEHIRTMLVANKSDAEGASDRLDVFREMFGQRFPIHVIAAEHGSGLEELRSAIFSFLKVIRVYSKQPGKPADKTAPFTCGIGSTVGDFAGLVHRDFVEKLKSARIWGTGVFDGQAVGREHVLHDRDIVELHV